MIEKQPIKISFSGGIDTKTDPWQVQAGKFLALENMVYTETGALKKRNGLSSTVIPAKTGGPIASFGNGIVSIAQAFESYSPALTAWENQTFFAPCTIASVPLVRNGIYQSSADMAVAANGLQCVVFGNYTLDLAGNVTETTIQYQVIDSASQQTVIPATTISGATGVFRAGSQFGAPVVYLLGSHFVIIYSTGSALQYLAISTSAPSTTSTGVVDASNGSLSGEGVVFGGNLYFTYSRGTALFGVTISSALSVGTPVSIVTAATRINCSSIYIDASGTYLWLFYVAQTAGPTFTAFTATVSLAWSVLATSGGASISVSTNNNMAITGTSMSTGIGFFFVSYAGSALFGTSVAYNGVSITGGTILSVVSRGLQIASKAFVSSSGATLVFTTNQSLNQPTYFLMDQSGHVFSRFAYENAGTQELFTKAVPLIRSNVSLSGSNISYPYLFIDVVVPINVGFANNAVFGQANVNLFTANLSPNSYPTAQGASNLNIGAGFTWMWDGSYLTEQDFFFFPDIVHETLFNIGSGAILAGTYNYQTIYQWTDNQGNIFRSAPSITNTITISSGNVNADIHVQVSTLRQSYKTGVQIYIYRSSTAQPTYYLIGTIANDPTVDTVTFDDVLPDSGIIGNQIIYTTGGVIEDLGPPAFSSFGSYDSRIWGIDAEDRNLLYFSKSLIEAAPIEWSDLLTYYVPPVIGIGGNTGPLYAIAPMDDKFIVFKENSIYYIVGSGPDNTGANSQYSAPQSIVSSVGTTNPNSVVLIPDGLMFQSNKGIWLLGRDLSTQYIGAPVEQYNSYVITSAQVIPGTTQVRFTTNQPGFILMYDYFYNQWGTHLGFSSNIVYSSCINNGLLTFVDSTGVVFQETLGTYVDGSAINVAMYFLTNWVALAGLQSYQRAYYFFMLARYLSAHTITWSIAYDYEDTVTESATVTPTTSAVEQNRIFFARQHCQSFQLTMQENISVAGAGFTMSGINAACGFKKGWRPISAAESVGAS